MFEQLELRAKAKTISESECGQFLRSFLRSWQQDLDILMAAEKSVAKEKSSETPKVTNSSQVKSALFSASSSSSSSSYPASSSATTFTYSGTKMS